jgi:hypothetical protein
MKPLRLFLKSSSLALMCMLTFSCVDNTYDTTKLNTEAEILQNGMDLPIGTLEVTMDSIFKDMDKSILKVKNGVYTFCVGGSMDLAAVNSALSGFTPASITNPAATVVNLIDGSTYTVPYTVPTTVNETHSSTAIVTLPNFKTSLMNPVDSILLANTSFTMLATTSSNMGGTDTNGSIQITCTPVGNVAEYYDMTTKAKLSSWTMAANAPKQIGIRILKPASGNSIQISCSANIHPTSSTALTITTKAMTSISVSVAFSAVDFQTVYGKVNYSKTDTNTDTFDAFGSMAANDNVLSFYNPTLKMYTNSNLGVPIKLNLTMSTKNTSTGATASLLGTNFTMLPAANPASSRTNVFTIDQPTNNLANLFKINPDKITMGYTIQADPATSNHFINKSTFLTITDTLEIPLKFGNDFKINMGDTIKNPFLDVLDQLATQENLAFGFVLNITNRIPLSMKLKMTGLDVNNAEKFSIESATIRGGDQIDANGFAQDTAFTSTELSFTRTQINQFKDVPNFKVEFIVSASTGTSGVAIRPSDYIKIDVAGRISGGVLIDLKKKPATN